MVVFNSLTDFIPLNAVPNCLLLALIAEHAQGVLRPALLARVHVPDFDTEVNVVVLRLLNVIWVNCLFVQSVSFHAYLLAVVVKKIHEACV